MAGLYIHIPFCGSKCAYCDFFSRRPGADAVSAMLDALEREMKFRHDFLPGRKLDTVYVGGGTPSLLAPEQLQGLLDRAAELWDCASLKEVTLEANPEDLSDKYVAELAGTGFDRLSIGVQSFDDGLLRLMNRRHSAQRAREAVRAAQSAGFGNITIDLIYGIPGMTHEQWERSLDEAIGLDVQHISAYHLTIEPGTVFGKMAKRDEQNKSPSAFRPVAEAESERQFETLRRKLSDAGFEHYEISNFALPGRRAIHNSAYWSGEPYLGIGPSAHSYDGKRRREWVVSDIEDYMAGAGTDAIYDGEDLSDTDLLNERIMTSLRTAEGIAVEKLNDNAAAQKFLADGLLVETGGKIAIPPEKFLLSDYIIGTLFISD